MRGSGTNGPNTATTLPGHPPPARPAHARRARPAPPARCPGDGCGGAGGRYSSLTEPPGRCGPGPPRPGRTPPCCPPASRRRRRGWRRPPPSPTPTAAGPAPCPPARSTERRRPPPSCECRCPAGRASQPRGQSVPNGLRCPLLPSAPSPSPQVPRCPSRGRGGSPPPCRQVLLLVVWGELARSWPFEVLLVCLGCWRTGCSSVTATLCA